MKNLLLVALLFIGYVTNAQDGIVELEMLNGDKRELTTKLVSFKGRTVFPDNDNSVIKGEENGEKVKIDKSEIKTIHLNINGNEYSVVKSAKNGVTTYHIGFWVTQNNFKIFKTYLHDHRSYGLGPSSINKVTTVEYYVLEEDNLRALNIKKDSEKLAESCPAFKEYLATKKKIKEDDVEEAFGFYDTKCP